MTSAQEQQMKSLLHGHDQTQDQEQVLSVEQSLQLVMIFLNTSLACICYTRELLRWNSACFRIRCIEHVCLVGVEPDQIYPNFLASQGGSLENSQEVRILVRGGNVRADHVLNMLEGGVFDAIKRAYLDTLHVFIATDADETRAILETYTFQFKYEKKRITTIHVGETEQAFTLRWSQKSFRAAIRALLRAMQGMPRVPSKCVLGMAISYTPECPASYEPEGFTHASHHDIDCDHWRTLWKETSGLPACFETAHHHVEAAARIMQSFSPPGSLVKDEIITRQLQNMQTTSSSRNYTLQTTQPATTSPMIKRKEDNRAEEITQPSKRTKGSDLAAARYGSRADPNSKSGPEDHGNIYHNNATNRRRKRSISKIFVAMDFTPDSQGFLDENEIEA